MRKLLYGVPAAALVAAAAVVGARDTPTATAAPVAPRATLVQVDRSAASAALPILRRHGASPVSKRLGVWRVPARSAPMLVPRLKQAGLILTSETDMLARPAGHLGAGDPLIRPWLTAVGADRAEPPGPGRAVTVIDSGLDLTHPEFANRPNTVALNEQRPGRRDAELYHGTAVSSMVAAPANGIGLVGVYPQALLKLWDASLGLGDVIAGIDAASQSGAGVINLSLGFDRPSRLLEDAVNRAFAGGSLIVAAAGNEREEGNPVEYPSYLPHVLTIAATSQSDAVTSFSNRTNYIDLAAPGDRIPVAVPTSFRESGFLAAASGTSFSAPIVSGASAWVWTARPELDNTQLFDLMRFSARDLPPSGFDPDTGFGMLDIPNALAAAAPAPDPQEPNEDIRLVRANGLFAAAKPALTRPGVMSASLSARVDAKEDPRDVYRVWVPARRTVVATLTPAGNVDLEGWAPATTTVARVSNRRLQRSARAGRATDTVRIRNAARSGAYYYVNVVAGGATGSSAYTLTLVTGSS
ncbi:MAG: S8 family serine peptidase [Actinobacteria bacterium]|nr:S8 family serine peptidase [Actinomycetota bacterium]